MKIAIECQSPLLQKSLELFLEKYLTSSKRCDIVVRDEECLNDERCFYIANNDKADLLKPFSKSQLILALEARYKELHIEESEVEDKEETSSEVMDFSILEKRIAFLTNEYQENIIKAVKAFYEK
ncbi:MAG: hypothetical protein U9O86_08210 [Campylobacterota bacterium]|nr:hypothetical protein [Campylobacterota bacterium]